MSNSPPLEPGLDFFNTPTEHGRSDTVPALSLAFWSSKLPCDKTNPEATMDFEKAQSIDVLVDFPLEPRFPVFQAEMSDM